MQKLSLIFARIGSNVQCLLPIINLRIKKIILSSAVHGNPGNDYLYKKNLWSLKVASCQTTERTNHAHATF